MSMTVAKMHLADLFHGGMTVRLRNLHLYLPSTGHGIGCYAGSLRDYRMASLSRFYPEPLYRILVAVLGGYLMTRWGSQAVLALPWEPEQAVVAGMLLGFAVFAATVVWVFVAGSLRIACRGLLLPAMVLFYFSGEGVL